MKFDEEGQVATIAEKDWICRRSYDILLNEVQFPPKEIFFDPNVLTICTGTEENYSYGGFFISAV